MMFKLMSGVLISIGFLAGCAMQYPPYDEPDPGSSKVARLRVVALPAVGVSVLSFPPGNARCFNKNDARKMAVENNTSGFKLSYSKKIGMPVKNALSAKWGSEFYVPADVPVIFEVTSSGTDGFLSAVCVNAFQFTPENGKSYELNTFAAPSGKRAVCEFRLTDISDPVNASVIPVLGVQIAKPNVGCPLN